MKKIIMMGAAVVLLVAATAVTGKAAGVSNVKVYEPPYVAAKGQDVIRLKANPNLKGHPNLSSNPALDALAYGAVSESVLWNFNVPDGYELYAGLIMDKHGNLYGTTRLGGTYDCYVEEDCFGGTVFELTPPSRVGGTWTNSILWNFGNGTDGAEPEAGMLMDKSGNLYGTTVNGGVYGTDFDDYFPEGGGTVFELKPPFKTGGSWTESILWSFGNSTDGAGPAAGLIADARGDFYSTTSSGGVYGDGTAFELKPPLARGGEWTESILWNFGNGSDGSNPYSDLVMDKRGNLYGTTNGGGLYPFNRGGIAFELTPPSTSMGSWTESILWNFGNGTDGAIPQAGLLMDANCNLYGTTFIGGVIGDGTVFELRRPSTIWGNWTESILWNFGNGTDGFAPLAGLFADKHGNLYGTTLYGGAYGTFEGTVFELTRPGDDQTQWNESLLWSFGGTSDDGYNPYAGLIADPRGNLYGTTGYGGTYGWGTVFELSMPGWGQ